MGEPWRSRRYACGELLYSALESLRALIAQLDVFRRESGGANDREFEIHALDSGLRTADDCQRLADLGVTDVCVTPWNPYQDRLSLKDKLEAIDSFDEDVIRLS